MTAIEIADGAERKVIKAAKKTLKRQESGSMKIKSLAKSVIEASSSNDAIPNCKDTVRKMISDSDVFEVDGKTVTLKKKRSSVGSIDSSSKKKSDDDEPKTKKSKKSKPDSAKAPAEDEASIVTWRKDHKIVIRDSRSGPEGAEATKLLAKNELYFPFQTFDSRNCVEVLNAKLIEQCTKVNGFEKPSPIQAQCWVSVLFFMCLECIF
jgi:hypothetical protein